jgi:hypothetical protein
VFVCVTLQVTKKMQGTKLPSSPIQIEEPAALPPTSSANARQQLITASGRSNDMLVNVDNPGPGSFAIDKKSTLEKGTHNSRLQVGFVTRSVLACALFVWSFCSIFSRWMVQRGCAAGGRD